MLNEERALQLIYAAIDEINGQLPPQSRLEKSPGTPLFGEASVLDSLALINLLVAVEDRIGAAGGAPVGLLDEVGKDNDATPLRTVSTLAAFVAEAQKASA